MTAAETNAAVKAAAEALFPVVMAHDSKERNCNCPACASWEVLFNADPDFAEGLARRWDFIGLYRPDWSRSMTCPTCEAYLRGDMTRHDMSKHGVGSAPEISPEQARTLLAASQSVYHTPIEPGDAP